MKKAGKVIAQHIMIFAAIAAYLFITNLLHIYCPFRTLTGIPCPCCGLLRSFLCLLQLDFSGSFYYHPLLIPILFTLFVAFHRDTPWMRFLSKRTADAVLYIGAAAVIVVYFIRLFFFCIPER